MEFTSPSPPTIDTCIDRHTNQGNMYPKHTYIMYLAVTLHNQHTIHDTFPSELVNTPPYICHPYVTHMFNSIYMTPSHIPNPQAIKPLVPLQLTHFSREKPFGRCYIRIYKFPPCPYFLFTYGQRIWTRIHIYYGNWIHIRSRNIILKHVGKWN